MKIVPLLVACACSVGFATIQLRSYTGGFGKWLPATCNTPVVSHLQQAFQASMELHAMTLGYQLACTNLYGKLRPNWAHPNEPVPREIQALWSPILQPICGDMATLEIQYSNTTQQVRHQKHPATLVGVSTRNLAPAHFYCLCRKRTELCRTEFCDTIITYNDTGNEYNLPESTWTTARNFMYHLAKQHRSLAQWQRRSPASHYCFLDGDIIIKHTTKQQLQEELARENETNKIIALNYRGYFGLAKYIFSADANVNCFAESSMDLYLPYSSHRDNEAWYLSQTDLVLRANLLEPFAFKVYNQIRSQNPAHAEYPRDGVQGIANLLRRNQEEGFSPGCYPPSNDARRNKVHECTFQGRHLFNLTFNETHRMS